MPFHTTCYLVISRPRPSIPASVTALIGRGHSRSPAADLFWFQPYGEDPTADDQELRQYLDALSEFAYRFVSTGEKHVQLGRYDHHPFVNMFIVTALDRQSEAFESNVLPPQAAAMSLANAHG